MAKSWEAGRGRRGVGEGKCGVCVPIYLAERESSAVCGGVSYAGVGFWS